MTNIAQESSKVNRMLVNRKDIRIILHDLAEFYKYPTRLLVEHLYSKGYSYKQIADIMGMSKQAVEDTYV